MFVFVFVSCPCLLFLFCLGGWDDDDSFIDSFHPMNPTYTQSICKLSFLNFGSQKQKTPTTHIYIYTHNNHNKNDYCTLRRTY